jgi:hypothetical protein
MSRVEVRDLGEPEAVVSYPLGTSNQVRLAQTVVTRHVLQPGWSWEKHARPLVGTASCELYHRGVVLSGRMGVRTDEGEELVIGPNQVFDLPPGHVTWVEGNEELVMVDWAGGAGFDTRPGEEARLLATILFTDIVDSTALARGAGDASWTRTVAMHDDVVRSVLAGFGGREVETAGDSFLVVFDSAESAIRCGLALVQALDAIRLPIRVGIHSGEVVVSDDQVRAWRCTPPPAHPGPGRTRRGPRVRHDPRPCRRRHRADVRVSGPAPSQGLGARVRAVRRDVTQNSRAGLGSGGSSHARSAQFGSTHGITTCRPGADAAPVRSRGPQKVSFERRLGTVVSSAGRSGALFVVEPGTTSPSPRTRSATPVGSRTATKRRT